MVQLSTAWNFCWKFDTKIKTIVVEFLFYKISVVLWKYGHVALLHAFIKLSIVLTPLMVSCIDFQLLLKLFMGSFLSLFYFRGVGVTT